jgi:cell division protease FtsH
MGRRWISSIALALLLLLVAAPPPRAGAGAADQTRQTAPPAPSQIASMAQILVWPAVIMFGIAAYTLVALRRRSSPGHDRIGQASHAGEYTKARTASTARATETRFTDVAGCDEAVEELAEIVTFLNRPEAFTRIGARMPRGVVLHGPPGTGKTLLARAVAGEAGVPFFAASAAEFVEVYVGTGAARVRDLFARARASESGAIVFIDELDAIGRRRADSGFGGNQEREVTLNQLLIELDGFAGSERVISIAATNRLDVLDPALLRPGRFDRQVAIDPPGQQGRLAILRLHAAGKPLAEDADLEALAAVTAGSSGATLGLIINEAAIVAARDGRSLITPDDLAEGHLRAALGPRKREQAWAAEEAEAVAWHEAGHALAAELQGDQPKPQIVSARPRGRAGGVALIGQSDQMLMTPDQVAARLVVAMAGRAAEILRNGTISSGAAADLEVANGLARDAVERFGFSAVVGSLVASWPGGQAAEVTRARVDEEVERAVSEAQERALALLSPHRSALANLAAALVEQDQVRRPQLLEILASNRAA